MPPLLPGYSLRLKRCLGVDSAIAYTVAARMAAIVGSVCTVLLIVRFMSPVEQGYYYTLLSLAFLQNVFEMGFAYVIQQLAAHESVSCVVCPDGRVEGDAIAHARLASILQLTLRWYFRAAIALAIVLLPLGIIFFSVRAHDVDHVSWQAPWAATVAGCAVNLLLTPLYSFLEGCNQVREIAKLRLLQALAVNAGSWTAIISGHGLYASAMVNSAAAVVGIMFLSQRRHLLFGLLRYQTLGTAISWRAEVWPFQWKVAVSWLCSYFTIQVFTPILFAWRGAVEAGRMGVSLNIAGYLPLVVIAWITTKATAFGQLVKLGRLHELDCLFFSAVRQASGVLLLLVVGCLSAIIAIQRLYPHIGARVESPGVFVLILFAAVSTFLVQAMAIYLRSFKQEPFLLQSVTVAAITVAGGSVLGPRWGALGIAVTYAFCSGVIGLASAIAIFYSKRREPTANAPLLLEKVR